MRERAYNEYRRYVALNNEEWGKLTGLLFGVGTGIYITLNYTSREVIGDLFISLIAKVCTIPVSAGFFGLMFSKAGAGIDVVANKRTLVTLVHDSLSYCRNRRRDSIAELQFFNGAPYSRTMPRSALELTLRHERSGESQDVVISGGSTQITPRVEVSSPDVGSGTENEETGTYAPGYQRRSMSE